MIRNPRRRILLAALLLLGLPPLLVVLINCHDEQLSPATQQWLKPIAHTVPASSNGYHAMIALGSPVADPMAASASALTAYNALAAEEQRGVLVDPQRYQDIQDRLLPRGARIIGQELNCPNQTDGCYAWMLRHRAELQALAEQHALQLQRYTAMLSLPDYDEDVPFTANTPLPTYSAALDLRKLYLSQTVYMFIDGHQAEAIQRWALNQRFWQQAANGSHTLINLIIAESALRNGLHLLDQLRQTDVQSVTLLREQTLPILTDTHRLRAAMAQIAIGEFQFTAATITQGFHGRGNGLFFHPTATLNFLRQHLGATVARNLPEFAAANTDLTGADICSHPLQWRSLYNPQGRMLVCIGSIEDSYFTKQQSLITLSDNIRSALMAPQAKTINRPAPAM